MRLHVRRAGTAERGTLVFIHGFPFDGSLWEPQLAALPDGWRGLAPDLRGFGRTELRATPGEVPSGRKLGGGVAHADEPVLTMDVLADDIAALIEDEGAGPAVVCGLSMGGYIALALMRRRPELVRGLVLADTRAGADGDEGRENRRRSAQTARSAGARPLAVAMIPGLFTRASIENRHPAVEQVRQMILATPPATLVAALAGMAARRDSTALLPEIRVPSLVLVGEEDTLTPPDAARAMADAIPDARLRIVPHAGHVANLENPDAFNEALAAFLGDLPGHAQADG